MLVRNIKEFKKKTIRKKIICLDYGKKKIGVAICDEQHKVSIPMRTIERSINFKEVLLKLILDFNIGGILVGLPFLEENKINKMSQSIKDMTKGIDFFLENNSIKLPIFFWDESFTSIEAEDMSKKFFKNTKLQKKKIDMYAAKIILDDYLNFVD